MIAGYRRRARSLPAASWLIRCVAIWLTVDCSIACGGAEPHIATHVAPRVGATVLHHGPLTDYVPAAGLRWLVVARLAELAKNAQFAPALDHLFPRARIEGFQRASGVDLRNTEMALAAGFDLAVLYAADLKGSGKEVVERFSDRLVAGADVAKPDPRIVRVTGVVGTTPETLVTIDDELVAASIGDPMPARIVELFSLGKLKHAPPALLGTALSSLPGSTRDHAIQFYAPGPFTGEWVTGARGLLASATAIAIVADPLEDTLRVQCLLAGAWNPTDHEPQLRKTWDDLTHSSLGKLFGLDSPEEAPIFHADPTLLSAEARFHLQPLAAGLHAAVAADVWEIMDISRDSAP